jgi:hypothetical protein
VSSADATWDSATWDAAKWVGTPSAPEGWGDDWRWWYQRATQVYAEVSAMVVEARWTTDGHALGDGTFRGDIQPGQITLRLWDPNHIFDNMPKEGAIWALYRPTGATWCWYYDSFTRGLIAPGDPTGADSVFVGSAWPTRLTTGRQDTNFGLQTANARLQSIVGAMNNAGLMLATVNANLAAQSQQVPAAAADSTGLAYPSLLASTRTAAANGVAWMSAAEANPGGPGVLTLNYARWETTTPRTLDHSQIIAGPPVTAAAAWMITLVQWAATAGATGAQSTLNVRNDLRLGGWGFQGPPPLRLAGDVTSTSGAEYAAARATAVQLYTDHSDPTQYYLSTLDVQSGRRTGPTGGPSAADWDPYTHVFAPTDVVSVADPTGASHPYRVVKSDHRLTARLWQTTHTLEWCTAATPLP